MSAVKGKNRQVPVTKAADIVIAVAKRKPALPAHLLHG